MYITNKNQNFDESIVNDAIDHTKEEWPNEACGAIINNKYERFENKAEDKADTFLIDDNDFNLAYINGEVECVIHSHNDSAMASKQDQIQQLQMDIPFGIINLRGKSVMHVVFWGDQLLIDPVEGREFFYGVFDCYSCVRDWYRLEYDISPPNPPRESFAFWHKGISMFENYIKAKTMPFHYVDVEDARPGDVLLYNINGTQYINHCGIYLENGKVLHHLYAQISRSMEMVFHRKFLMKVLRHEPDWDGYNDSDNWSKNIMENE